MRNIVKMGGILLAISLVAALALGYVNQVTKPLIKQNQLLTNQAAMGRLLPTVVDNKFSDDMPATDGGTVVGYNIGYNGETPVGYVLSVNVGGYGGTIEMLVGIDSDGVVTGAEITKHSETPGLGANASNEKFIGQYVNKTGPFIVTKAVPTDDSEVQAITAATITSVAVTNGVNDAIAYYQTNLAKGGN